jgi:hypothetical protein
MTSLKALTNSSHVITYVFLVAPTSGETFTVDFQDVNNDADGFDCTGLVNADVTLSSGWLLNGGGPADAVSPADCEVYLIADTAPSNPIVVTIASTHMLNPTNITSYNIYLSGSGETMTLQVPIVDSDTVDITGYISSSLSFDLDTTTLASGATYPDCDAISCLAYEGQTLTIPTNYTVDLGNLTIAFVNKSSSGEVLHADTGTGVINSIYFDLSTNAASGAVVTYKSLNGELRGPGHNTTIANDLDIPSVADGSTNITAGIAAYGIQMSSLPGYLRLGTGTQTVNCGSTVDTYCVMGAIEEGTGNNLQTAQPIYTTTGPIEKGRGKIDVAAAIDGTNVPGTYIDQITFIATSTF